MKKAWIIWGGWDGHEPKLVAARFARILREAGYEVEIFDDLSALENREALNEIELKDEDEDDDIVYTAAGPTRTMAPRPPETTNALEIPDVQVDWSDYYRNIVDVLEGRAELIVKPEEALRVMKVIDLMFKASREGCGQKCEI